MVFRTKVAKNLLGEGRRKYYDLSSLSGVEGISPAE